MNNEILIKAARFYLQHIGKRGNEKQVAAFIAKFSELMILRLAIDRGFKA